MRVSLFFCSCFEFLTSKPVTTWSFWLWPRSKAIEQLLTSVLFFSFPVKPQIYEKAVSPLPEPILYPFGSRQILTCTVYGIPQPTIKWLWRPCNHNHSKAR